jgi:hypothetical protein
MRKRTLSGDRSFLEKKARPHFLSILFFSFLLSIASQAQVTVTGKVSDSVGNTISGASVVIKENNIGTTTGTDGTYQLRSVPARATLIFSYVGLQTQETRLAANQTTLNVSLRIDPSSLEGVVITGFQRISMVYLM